MGSRYRHLRKQLSSHASAIKTPARYLAVLVYRLLIRGEAWVDRGAATFERRRTERELAQSEIQGARKRIQAGSHHPSELGRHPTNPIYKARYTRAGLQCVLLAIQRDTSTHFSTPKIENTQRQTGHLPTQVDESFWRVVCAT
jgi:hypothetical protein